MPGFWLISVRIRINIVATIDRTAGIESQMSIKSRFDHDWSRFGDLDQLHRISLHFKCNDLLNRLTFALKYFRLIKHIVSQEKICSFFPFCEKNWNMIQQLSEIWISMDFRQCLKSKLKVQNSNNLWILLHIVYLNYGAVCLKSAL